MEPGSHRGPFQRIQSYGLGNLFRRVTGVWWPPRSSKPLSARPTGRGVFDSHPLRHLDEQWTNL